MSRRSNPATDRAEQNRQTLKSVVKLDANKSCADCKRNKHPRWASWNLGIFVCIRCSGIHRGMGTHISRVKSVDLDSWTDEQLQSMLKWGNARANKYWESKLAPGHVPSEAKIENFIRTKYESKRWVLDGGMPDPATLDAEPDDDVPLNVVQEKVKLERSSSQRASTSRASAPPQSVDLIGDTDPAPSRPRTTAPNPRPPPPKAEAAPPKQTRAGDSLLGLDMFGDAPAAPPSRPSSTVAGSAAQSRPDLKQSILSLYAAPKPAPQTASQPRHASSGSLGGMASSPVASSQSNVATLNDAFGGLSFSTQQPKPTTFSGLESLSSVRSPPLAQPPALGSGGKFFDAPKPPTAKTTRPPVQQERSNTSSSGFGDFTSAPAAAPNPVGSSGMTDLLDLSLGSTPAPPPAAPPPKVTSEASAFNLSAPKPAPASQPKSEPAPNYAGLSNMDPWGTDAWATNSGPSNPTTSTTLAPTQSQPTPSFASAQAVPSSQPVIEQDEDFGGWSSAAVPNAGAAAAPKTGAGSGGFAAGGDDLFSNVWE